MAQQAHAYVSHIAGRRSASGIGLALSFVAAVFAVLVIAIFYPSSDGRVGDTHNERPAVKSVKTVTVPPLSPAKTTPTDPR